MTPYLVSIKKDRFQLISTFEDFVNYWKVRDISERKTLIRKVLIETDETMKVTALMSNDDDEGCFFSGNST